VKRAGLALILSTAVAVAAFAFGASADSASAHQSGCHTKHECPSDHATYRWGPKRLLCVKPTSDKRNASFKINVRYAGLPYLCKR
jgi:hypothetical protein